MTDKSIPRQKSERRDGDRRKKHIPVKVDRRKSQNRKTTEDRRQTSS